MTSDHKSTHSGDPALIADRKTAIEEFMKQ